MTSAFTHLLAKSSRTPAAPRPPEALAGHLRDVTRTARSLTEEWGETSLRSLGLDPKIYLPRLQTALPRAALAHDLGKSNDQFQRLVRADRSLVAQAGWHEQFSVWLSLHFSALGDWLFADCDEGLREAIRFAILGHHLRVADGSEVRLTDRSRALEVAILAGHPGFQAALEVGSTELGLGPPPVLSDVGIDLVEPDLFDDPMRRWLVGAGRWWQNAPDDERRFTAAIKALLIAADVAGSAVPRMPADPLAWMQRALSELCSEQILRDVVATRLGGREPRPFQRAVAESRSRVTFVRAGCGSGKTAAAYLWAAQQATGRKLFFCYPTTGTASQGFADYVPPDQFEAALIHSRATADLADLLTNGTEEAEDRLDWLSRFAALAAWAAPITVCTTDAVLGLLQNNRTGLFSTAPILLGAFVFDEIHQYDDRLFGALLRFLEALRGVPILLMTASLPSARLAALEQALGRHGETLGVIEGPADLEAIKRYRVEPAPEDRAWHKVEHVLREGGKVLWVANTVKRATALAQLAESKGLHPRPYHSRYRYADRLERHRDVVQAFGSDTPGEQLAITTQVCEVSLDLSADLLVSDLAPIPALIQRLGRLNRRASPASPVHPAPALILEPPAAAPYREPELIAARGWLRLLGSAPVSQSDLSAAFEELAGATPVSTGSLRSAWLDGGILAAPASLREEGLTIPVIRAEDLSQLEDLSRVDETRAIIRLTIPMPIGPVQRQLGGWQRRGGALVAPAGSLIYDARFGGHWR